MLLHDEIERESAVIGVKLQLDSLMCQWESNLRQNESNNLNIVEGLYKSAVKSGNNVTGS